MKSRIVCLLTSLITTYTFAQSSFVAEGKTVKTGSVVKTYNFYYQYGDSITLFFSDSIVTFTNPGRTIVKEIGYSEHYKESFTRIDYFRTNKEDSISKHFNGNKLAMIYETRFDRLDRIVYYAMKDFRSGYDGGFKWTYEYHDSLISSGKFTTQTVFDNDAYGGKRFNFRVISEYDKKNRKIKETRESMQNDLMAQITTYTYDNKDSLIEEKIRTGENENIFSSTNNRLNTPCNMEIEKTLVVSKFSDLSPLIEQMLIDNKEMLTSDKCENFICRYFSSNKKINIFIRKVQPYWEGGRNVSVIIDKTQQ